VVRFDRLKRAIYLSVLLAALAAAHAAFPQPASSSRTNDALSGAQPIDEIQSSQDSADLIDPLMRAGLSFREQGDVELAIAAFERARHLVRVNYGLSSFKEAPLLRQLVQIEQARGNAAAAWERSSRSCSA
jgi:hypothetical protein